MTSREVEALRDEYVMWRAARGRGENAEAWEKVEAAIAAPYVEALREAVEELNTIDINMLEGRPTYVSQNVLNRLRALVDRPEDGEEAGG